MKYIFHAGLLKWSCISICYLNVESRFFIITLCLISELLLKIIIFLGLSSVVKPLLTIVISNQESPTLTHVVHCRAMTFIYTNEMIELGVSVFQKSSIIWEYQLRVLSSISVSQGSKYAGEIYNILYPIMPAGYESYPIIKMHKYGLCDV
jgi:hypothetical protein